MEITVDIDTSPIAKLGERYQKAKGEMLRYAAQDMTLFLMINSPVDHGLLKQWFIESLDEEEAHIKSPAEYAIYQDQGTKAHMIRPVNAKALHWDGHFSKGHMVSGIQGKHFVQTSFDQMTPRLGGHLMRALEESE